MPATATTPQLWDSVKAELASALPPDIFQMWFTPVTCLKVEGDAITLGVPTDFAAIWINDNYLDLIAQKLRLSTGRVFKVFLESAGRAEPAKPASAEPAKVVRHGARRNGAVRAEERAQTFAQLNPRNTFDTFVIGPTSQLAHAAALAVAQAPAQAYNPLFLYGETGLGKTHLMHAVGHHILRTNPEARIAYLSSEKFTNEFIQAIQENTLTRFRQRYRHVDVLLLDDVQFLGGKERIQEEFFHTFNDLFESGKQIFLSSDRPASEIAKLESRLVSRFQWGLMADIQPPQYETRLAILRSKAVSMRFNLPDDVLSFIAQHIVRNIRRLEGALIKVASYAQLTGRPVTVNDAERLLADVLAEEAQRQITIDTIQKRVADHFQLRHSDMVSRRRPANIANARQVAMYLSRLLTRHSLQEIGEAFGGRDHGTVIHACRTVENLMEQEDSVRSNVEYLKAQLSR
ncbi:MAG: chromosomal replication initiator protein DnaA [Opitutaceae bacterium]|nr:chromosomal replication initiator protein DnaA [Opitutaceae bacterium]